MLFLNKVYLTVALACCLLALVEWPDANADPDVVDVIQGWALSSLVRERQVLVEAALSNAGFLGVDLHWDAVKTDSGIEHQ
jgi:hypothetical protein